MQRPPDCDPVSNSAEQAVTDTNPIRVAQLLHTMAHGGVETAILNWNLTFDRRRIDARFICFANPGATEQAFVNAANAAGFQIDAFLPWSRAKPILRAARILADYLRRERIDVLHCHNTYANIVGLLAARLTPVRTITTMYVWGDFGFRRNVLQWLDARLMRYFDQVSAHCESCFRDTVARGIDPARLELLICGYPATTIQLTRAERQRMRGETGLHPGETVIVYMARFWPEKAHDNLLQAFQMLLAKHPQCRLLLPGVGPELETVRALAENSGLIGPVQFLGFHSQPDILLAISDIQVHPSDNEGVALAVCAGMSAGLPMVATRVGGLPEILKDGKNAVLIEPRQPEALADAIAFLIEQPEKAAALGSAARRFIQEEYSLEVATARVESCYETMVAGARR